MEDLVTIVIPTNNRLALLQKAIASVLAQTYRHWELVIVDDGSTDGTQSYVREITDMRIRLIDSANRGNVAAMRNEGVRSAHGHWVAFLDSDDCWLPRKLELQVAMLRLEKKEWCYCRYELMDESGAYLPHKTNVFRPLTGWVASDMVRTRTDITICSVIVVRSLFEKIGGFDEYPNLAHRADYDFSLRLAIAAEVTVVNDALVLVREHANRSTRQLNNGHERTATMLYHFIQKPIDPEVKRLAKRKLAFHLGETTIEKIRRREYLLAIRQFIKAMKYGDRWRHLASVARRSIFFSDFNSNS